MISLPMVNICGLSDIYSHSGLIGAAITQTDHTLQLTINSAKSLPEAIIKQVCYLAIVGVDSNVKEPMRILSSALSDTHK